MNTVAPKDASIGEGSRAKTLAAPLDRALECLPINLDEELIRYRRALRGEGPMVVSNRLRRRRRNGLDLIQVPAKPVGSQPAVAPPPLPANPNAAPSAAMQPDPAIPAQTTAGLATIGGPLAPYDPIPDDYLETTEALLNAHGYGDGDTSGYGEPDYAPTLLQRLSTPLGLGALLLLLVSCAGFGFLITSPQTVQHLWQHPALQALRGQSPDADPTPTTEEFAGGGSQSFQGMGPDLSQREFADLDLNDLSALPSEDRRSLASTPTAEVAPGEAAVTRPEAASTGSASGDDSDSTAARASDAAPATVPQPQAVAPRTVVRPLVTARPVTPPRPAAPAQPSTAPAASQAPAPSAAPPTAAAPAAPAASPNYYVVTSYTGDPSLDQARQAVDQAYVRNFPVGARIQMGAFSQESSAQSLVNQLQNQGISAEVYRPE